MRLNVFSWSPTNDADDVTEWTLGDGTGEQLYDRLSESHPELSATMLFLTGGATSDSSRAFCDAHIDQVVEKPFNSSDLKDLVGGLIG